MAKRATISLLVMIFICCACSDNPSMIDSEPDSPEPEPEPIPTCEFPNVVQLQSEFASHMRDISFEAAANNLVGTWFGTVNLPSGWNPPNPYNVIVRFFERDSLKVRYSAYNVTDYGSALYYGDDRDSPEKTFELKYVSVDGSFGGDMAVLIVRPLFDQIENLKFYNNYKNLNFDIIHLKQYGPLQFSLSRLPSATTATPYPDQGSNNETCTPPKVIQLGSDLNIRTDLSLAIAKDNLKGTWFATAIAPFIPSSHHLIIKFVDHEGFKLRYSAYNITHNGAALYYGTDDGSADKIFELKSLKDDGSFEGQIGLSSEVGAAPRLDEVRHLWFYNDLENLTFEIWHTNSEEPITLHLFKLPAASQSES
jgi:hypothetical protein